MASHNAQDKSALRKFTDDDLWEELQRRQRGAYKIPRESRPSFHPCDVCQHFVFWTRECDPPDDYNPCAKGHAMNFRVPSHPSDDDNGYHLRGCKDRLPRAVQEEE